jgi:hypothetical protein
MQINQERTMKRLKIIAMLAALAIPAIAATKLEVPASGSEAEEPKASAVAAKAPKSVGYRMRCWQFGMLIMDANELDVPADSPAYSLKLADRAHAPVYLAQAGTATCLIQRPEPIGAYRK